MFTSRAVLVLVAGMACPAMAAFAACNGNNPAGCVLIAEAQQNDNLRLVQRTVNNRVDALILRRQMPSGLSAGDGESAETSGYVSPSYSGSKLRNAYDGTSSALFAGVDRSFGESLVIGLGLGGSFGDVNNAGRGGQTSESYTVSPYLVYYLTDHLSIDASVGYASATTRYDTADLWLGNGRQSSNSSFGAVNLSGAYWMDQFNLTWKLGYVESRVRNDAFAFSSGLRLNASDARLSQVQASLMAAYRAGDWLPYVRATYENDVAKTTSPSTDDSGSVWAVGIRRIGLGKLSLGIEASVLEGRPTRNESLSASIAYSF